MSHATINNLKKLNIASVAIWNMHSIETNVK